MDSSIEIERKSVTVSDFLSYIRRQCAKKNMEMYIDKDEFINPMSPGSNEICEFTFDDERRGHGYYYQICKD